MSAQYAQLTNKCRYKRLQKKQKEIINPAQAAVTFSDVSKLKHSTSSITRLTL